MGSGRAALLGSCTSVDLSAAALMSLWRLQQLPCPRQTALPSCGLNSVETRAGRLPNRLLLFVALLTERPKSLCCCPVLQSTEHLNMNSGLFWLKASVCTIGLMERIAARLAREEAWDQSVYNQEIFFLSHDNYESPHVSVRVMNIYRWVLHARAPHGCMMGGG